MGIGSGLGATLGFATETAWNTYTAPDHFVTFEKESLALKKNIVQSHALHGGLYDLASRRAYTTHTVDGQIDMDLYDRQLGPLFKQMLGTVASGPTEIATSGAYTTVFAPGDTLGESLTVQVGRPQTGGTVTPFTYTGAKVTEWTLAVQVSKQATLSVTLDGATEATSQTYVAPSYLASNMLQFAEGQLLLGGTCSTSSGVTTVSGNSALAVVKSISLKGANKTANDRFFLGSSGTKAEQISDGFRGITGEMEVEFENLTDIYDAFAADTPTALQLTFTGPVIGTGSNHSSVQVLIPEIFFDGEPPQVEGPQVLVQKVKFTGLDDGTNNPVQITTVSLDSTV